MLGGWGWLEEHMKELCFFLNIESDYYSNGISLPGGSEVKVSACNAGDLGSIPGSGRSPREGNGNPRQYPCLENSVDRGTWRATVLRIPKSQMWLNDCAHTHSLRQICSLCQSYWKCFSAVSLLFFVVLWFLLFSFPLL